MYSNGGGSIKGSTQRPEKRRPFFKKAYGTVDEGISNCHLTAIAIFGPFTITLFSSEKGIENTQPKLWLETTKPVAPESRE